MVRLSASRTGRLYPQEMFLVLIFTRGWVDPRAMVRLVGNTWLKNPVTPPGIDPRTVRVVAQCLNQYATPGPTSIPVIGLTYPVTWHGFLRWHASFSAHRLAWLSAIRLTLRFFFTKALLCLSSKTLLLSHPILCATSVESCKETLFNISVTPRWMSLKHSPCMASFTFGMRIEYASANRAHCSMSKLLTREKKHTYFDGDKMTTTDATGRRICREECVVSISKHTLAVRTICCSNNLFAGCSEKKSI